ncbi:MAG TPA: hypothetical protein VKU19_18305 [Bryobacteraceae bacterium]|nr:hypothetical protein [Bryobacteraceae bacterium]
MLNYYESVVIEYLRADRAVFVNTECCIQVNPSDNPDKSGPHWYCDAVALDFRSKTVFLCEISYEKHLGKLMNRMKGWHENWGGLVAGLRRDCQLYPLDWPVTPWLFVRQEHRKLVRERLEGIANGQPLKFDPKITPLECTVPWHYCTYNRKGDCCAASAR